MMLETIPAEGRKEVHILAELYRVTLERDTTGATTRARIGIGIVDDYLGYLAAVGRARGTWSSYAYDLAVFCRWLAATQTAGGIESALKALTGGQVFAFVEDQMRPRDGERPLAPATVYRRVVALAKFFDWAEATGFVERSPVPRERPRGPRGRWRVARAAFPRLPRVLPRPARVDEVAAFSDTLRTWRDRALVALMAGAGLRLSEALGLRLDDLDWGGKQVFVRRGKGGRQRYAMVPDMAWAALKAYLDGERPDPATTPADDRPLFVVLRGSRRGQPLTAPGVQSLFRHHRRLAQTPNATPHRLRHTCGTELHRAGMPLEFLQDQLGHRCLDSTRLYVHLSNERLRAAYLEVETRMYRALTESEGR